VAGSRSVGILGGTFNPPHLGHVAVAACAREQLRLDSVVLMPVHSPPHKPGGADPGPAHRLEMCRLAVAGADGLRACATEVERGGPSYTVDTLDEVHASHREVRLTLIMGADTASTLGSWREPATILRLADLAIAGRAGSERERALDVVAAIGGEQARSRTRLLSMDTIEISSSYVRVLLARGEPVEQLVGRAVAGYIAEHELYAASVAEEG
jgi:nicotinate-nucleotide adenylyltransferase